MEMSKTRTRPGMLTTGCLLLSLLVPPAFVASLPVPAMASEGWYSGGGVTDPTQYADYATSVVGNTYQGDIEAATRLGLIVGHDDRTFRPNDNITVGQFANIIARNYWGQGGTEAENLAYLRSLGLNVDNPQAALNVGQVQQAAGALQGQQGVADLAILHDARNGSLSGVGAGGGITRGQAVDLLYPSTPGMPSSGGGVPSSPPSPPSGGERGHRATMRAQITPNPVQAGQTIVLTADTRHVVSVQAYLPWTSVRLTRPGYVWTATISVPATQAAGSYLVRFSGIDEDDAPCETSIELVVTAPDEGGDVEFVITD